MDIKMIQVVVKFANNDEYVYKCTVEEGQKAIYDWYADEPEIKLGKDYIYSKTREGKVWIKEVVFIK